MLDHLGLKVADLARSRAFYAAALAPLGYGLVAAGTGFAAFGPPQRPLFWLYAGGRRAAVPLHIAFQAGDHAAVDGFHAAALAAGGVDNGAAGPRPDYHPHYYGGFVLDPDGHNVEAVCHEPV